MIKEFDSKDTFFFVDPPYVGHNAESPRTSSTRTSSGRSSTVSKGKFLITYGTRGQLDTSGFAMKRFGTPRTIRTMRGVGGSKWLNQLLISNYQLTKKRLGLFELEDVEAALELPDDVAADLDYARALAADLGTIVTEPVVLTLAGELGRIDSANDERSRVLARELLPLTVAAVLAKRIPIVKTADERYVLGIVLEPETVDAQQDIYSAAEVREAAHKFMAEYRNRGLMHQRIVNDKVDIVESYLAPVDFEVGGQKVKKGTWLLAEHILDDELWQQVKSGALGGFSIGGSAVRNPEHEAA